MCLKMMSSLFFDNRRTKLRKRANVIDLVIIVASVAALAILIVFAYMLYFNIDANVQAMSTDTIPTEAKQSSNIVREKILENMDWVFLVFWLTSFLAAMISAWFIDTYPFFFFFSVFVLVVIMVAIVPLANVLESVLSDSQVVAFTAEFPIILFFVNNLFTVSVIMGFCILIALYSKVRTI